MRLPPFRIRTFMIAVAVVGLMAAPVAHWLRSSQRTFNVLVSRTVPKGPTLADLEAIAGPAIRPAMSDRFASGMRRWVVRNEARNPDGWQEGDFWACYDFPGGSRWWFQVRNGRLVNYDPAVLATQTQAAPPTVVGK